MIMLIMCMTHTASGGLHHRYYQAADGTMEISRPCRAHLTALPHPLQACYRKHENENEKKGAYEQRFG